MSRTDLFSRFSSRAQSSFEFLLLAGFMALVLSSFFVVINQRIGDERKISQEANFDSLAVLLKTELTVANSVKDGFQRPLELPSQINGVDYEVFLNDSDEITIRGGDFERVLFLPFQIRILNGSFSSFQGVIPKEVMLVKSGGRLYLKVDVGPEVCDGLDNNGNIVVDDGVLKLCYLVVDGVKVAEAYACSADDLPAGYVCS